MKPDFVIAGRSIRWAQSNVHKGTTKLNSLRVTAATPRPFAKCWLFAAVFLAMVSASAAAPPLSAKTLNPVEEWIVAQLQAGEVADLLKQFPDKEKDKRKLSARFLQDLLMGTLPGFKPHRHGMQIVGAIIEGPLDLENAQIPGDVSLQRCQFNASTIFNGANVAQDMSFENSTFKADAHFTGMKVGRAIFNGAVFEGPVDFESAEIATGIEMQAAKFQNVEQGAAFSGMKVGNAFFNDAVFEGPAAFLKADIAGMFLAAKSKFQNKEQGVNFSGMKVDGYVFFDEAVFEGPVNFTFAVFDSTFSANQAQFRNSEKEVSFSGMKVGGYAFFNDATFEGPVNFTLADIASTFAANGARFQNVQQGATFNSIKIGGLVSLKNVLFKGPVNFISADISGTFAADGTKFQNKETNFGAMKVGGDALFNGAIFEGLVSLSGAGIAGNLGAQGTRFQNKEKEANFNGVKVGGYAFFNDAVFEGPVYFFLADIAGSFAAGNTRFQNKEKEVNFGGMKVRGYSFFNDAVFEGPVKFEDSDLGWVDFSKASLPKDPTRLHMQGMSYKYIRAASEEPESHKSLLGLAGQSAYSADVYGNLEAFFLRQGYRGDADRAFIAGKRRERKEYLHGMSWFGSWLLDWLVGYGRRPWQAGIPCAVLVAFGCILFSPKKMEPQKPEDTPRVYSRFWYSLGLFLPFVDLQADKVWKPKADQTFLRNYMRLHALLGWILIPIVLAALTGLIK